MNLAPYIDVATAMYEINDLGCHNLGHIHRMLDHAKEIIGFIGFKFLSKELELAIWYHDVIFVPGKRNNEFNSAKFFKVVATQLGLPYGGVLIEQLILLTSRHLDVLNTGDENVIGYTDMVMLDADLAGFANTNYSEYLDINAALRTESAHLSDTEYVTGQIGFLEALLSKPSIYYTDYAKAVWEDRARLNIGKLFTCCERPIFKKCKYVTSTT